MEDNKRFPMEDSNKRFLVIIATLGLIWIAGYLAILPAVNSIARDKQATATLVQKMEDLQQIQFSPQPENIEKMEMQNQNLQQSFQDLVSRLNYRSPKPPDESNMALFNYYRNQTLTKLTQQAKQVKMELNPSIFPYPTSNRDFHVGYWYALDMGSKIISLLLELDGEQNQIQVISKIDYPIAEFLPSAKKLLLREFNMQIHMESKFSFVTKILWQCMQDGYTIPNYLFCIETNSNKVEDALNLTNLRQSFLEHKLSMGADVVIEAKEGKWSIWDKSNNSQYAAIKKGNYLNMYSSFAMPFLRVKHLEIKRHPERFDGSVMVKLTLAVLQVDAEGEVETDSVANLKPDDKGWKHQQNWDRH